MAQVFLAREPHLKRLVAVKVLSPDRYDDTGARRRFQREAQSAARINHPNVCTVYSVGSLSDGTPYLVSPFVKGTTLAQRLKAEGRLGTEEVRQVIREMASALAAAHKLGIIHRDVRPDNVLREEETGRHFLSDFGIAGVLERGDDLEPRITVTGELLGDPAYISPEHVEGKPLTDRADVYSLGIMAHQLLTGHTPPPAQTSEKHQTTSVIPPDLSPLREYLGQTDPDLVDLVTRCLAMDPASRPAAADISRRCDERERNLERIAAAPSSIPRPAANLLSLLMERRFLQILGVFLLGGWFLIEFTDQLERRGILPEPANALAWNTAAFGFIATNILAWYHGSPGKHEMTGLEKVLLALVGLGWVVGCVVVVAG
jgi:serine/threonine protein kinase